MAKHLYLHVPFCQSICYYCDFCHRLYDAATSDKWLGELAEEIKSQNIDKELSTVYIGGGTPTSLSYEQIIRLLSLLKEYTSKLEEYTIEANPENIDEKKIDIFKHFGINRVSLGVEAYQDRLLAMMNRHHNFEDVQKAVSILRSKGIHNISLDLLYSLPSQSLDDFKESLEAVVALDVPHISLYSLTIEEHSVFGQRGYKPLDEDLEADMYEMAVAYLEYEGYIQYEIANFAKPGYYSKHNLAYWHYNDFYGLSLGASGKINNIRYDNTRNMQKYLRHEYRENIIELSKKDMMFEETMMSLRTIWGIDLKRFKLRYGEDFKEVYKKPLDRYPDAFISDDKYLRVKNRELLNTLLLAFLD